MVCSGGIWDGRSARTGELAFALRDLGADFVPINILNPIPGTMSERPLMAPLKFSIIACFRFILPAEIM
jgi:biotin synthase